MRDSRQGPACIPDPLRLRVGTAAESAFSAYHSPWLGHSAWQKVMGGHCHGAVTFQRQPPGRGPEVGRICSRSPGIKQIPAAGSREASVWTSQTRARSRRQLLRAQGPRVCHHRHSTGPATWAPWRGAPTPERGAPSNDLAPARGTPSCPDPRKRRRRRLVRFSC